MKQKLFTLLLAFIAAISFAHAKDIASGSFKNGGTWKITQDGELYVDAATVPDYTNRGGTIIVQFGSNAYYGSATTAHGAHTVIE